MAELKEQWFQEEGYHLHIIPTKKFKTNVLMIRFLAPLNRKNVTRRALLPLVMQKGTLKRPTERELRSKLDELYGAQLYVDCSKKGENHLITFQMSFVNEKFLPNQEMITSEMIELMKELITEPNVENGGFRQEVIEREKQTLKQKIESIKDNKMSYANMRLIDEMCKGEPYETHVHGYLDDLDQINEKNLYEEYQNMLKNDKMDIYVLGDIEIDSIQDEIQQKFSFERQPKYTPVLSNHDKVKTEYNEVFEPQKVQQGKLHIGFRTNTTFKDQDYYILQVYNGLFGGFPHSKLFMNVREKNQLAYYASSRIESHKGLLLVFSGIAPEAYDQAKKIILEQWESMKKGDFTKEEVEKTKRLTINQIKETLDHPGGIIELMYHQVLANNQITESEIFEQIEAVSIEDLAQFSNKIELDTIYFLTSEGEKH